MAYFTYLIPADFPNKEQVFPALFAGGPATKAGNRVFLEAFDKKTALQDLLKFFRDAEVADPETEVGKLSGGQQNTKIGVPLERAGAPFSPLSSPSGFGEDTSDSVILGDADAWASHHRQEDVRAGKYDRGPFETAPAPDSMKDISPFGDIGLGIHDTEENRLKNEMRESIREDKEQRIRDARQVALDKTRKEGLEDWAAFGEAIDEWAAGAGPNKNAKNVIGDSELWETIGLDLVDRGEAVDIRDLIDNPDQYLSNLPKDQRDVVYEDAAGVSTLNPWLEQAMLLAGQQAGYVSQEQIQFIESSAIRDIAVHQRDSALEVAEEEGETRETIATIEADANQEIAELDRNLRESEFRYLDRKNTLEFNLQQRAQQNEYNLLVRQGKRSESDAVRQHALSMEQFATQRETAGLQFKTEQERLESAERERIRIQEAQLAEQTSQREQFFEQQRVELEQYTQQTNLQRMQDELTAQVQKEIAQQRTITDVRVADIQKNTAIEAGEKERLIALRQSEEAEAIAALQREAQVTVAGIQASTGLQAAQAQAGAVTGAAALGAEAAGPFGYVGAGIDPADRAQRLTEAQTILGEQFNPYALTGTQFTGMQGLQARAGATPFGALVTAPATEQQQAQTYGDLLALQQAQAAQGPFQSLQLGAQGDEAARQQRMADISTIQRGGLTPTQQIALAQAPGNPFGLTATEQMALQNSLARGGLTPTQRLTEVQAGAAPQNMANYLNFIGNPAAVGFAGQSGFLQNVADSPEGNIPASLFGLNVPQNAPTVPVNPTLANLTDLSDEQLGFYQGQMAAQNYQTPSQIYQQAQTVTPQGV